MRQEAPTVTPLQRAVLPFLVLVSGVCGISYEILYTRLLGNLLGNQFTINATVLLTFLLGIGLGALYAHRLAPRLWLIELGIGVYAALLVLAYPLIDAIIYELLPSLGTNLYIAALASFILLAPPAFLIGCSVPLFSAYLGAYRTRGAFALTYGIYNLGAALTALVMEFALVRTIGLRGATLAAAVLNAVVALTLWRMRLSAPVAPERTHGAWRFPRRVLTVLALASVGSAVFQLLVIKLAEFILGPYNETFALVLATVLLGIALGAFLTGRLGLTLTGSLVLALGGLAWILIALERGVEIYAGLYESVAPSYALLVLMKFGLVFALLGPAAAGFGATIPALLGAYRDVARESGQLLFVSSMGNVAGFLLMAFVLHRFMDYGTLVLVLVLALTLTLLIHQGFRTRSTLATAALVAVAALGYTGVWNETLLYAGHRTFRATENMQAQLSSRVTAKAFKGAEDVFAITTVDDVPYFFLNGFISVPLGGQKATEEIVGALSSMFAPRLDRALVLGLGSGATAGVVGLAFDTTDVVETNKVILQNLDPLAPYNFDIATQPDVNIVHDDGFRFMRTTDARYALILNTVTSPQFFNSSKLYTVEFFEHVKPRLAEGGVYVTWIDGVIGDHGVNIILETLADSFENCWLNYLTGTYYFLACSDDPLGLHQVEAVAAHPVLSAYFRDDYDLDLRWLPYSVLSTDAFALRPSPTGSPSAINRLDHPILEFERARLAKPKGGFMPGFRARLVERTDLDVLQSDIGATWPWNRGGFAFFGEQRADPGEALHAILREVGRRQPPSPEAFERAALDFADEVGTAGACLAAGRTLVRRGRFSAAVLALTEAPEAESADEGSRMAYYLGAAYEGLDDSAGAERAYREALRLNPDADRARRALERLLAIATGVSGRDASADVATTVAAGAD